MIVLRDLDNNGDECDQEIYCDYRCFGDVRYPTWNVNNGYALAYLSRHLFSLSESDKYNVYENEHLIPNSHYPTISDFLSVDYSEYCYSCKTKLN